MTVASGQALASSKEPSQSHRAAADHSEDGILSTLLKLPDFLLGDFHSSSCLNAAITLQKEGRQKALERLYQLAGRSGQESKVLVLCRLLFDKPRTGGYPVLEMGGADFLGGTAVSDWPRCPVALVDGVPFVTVWGYRSGGGDPLTQDFVQDCAGLCRWRTTPYKEKSRAERLAALSKLLHSRKWKRRLKADEIKFLERQAN